MFMYYHSTRDASCRITAAEAILQGMAPDGGLYLPAETAKLDWAALAGKSYPEVACAVLKLFLPDYDADFLQAAASRAYGDAFGGKAGYLVPVSKNLYSLELWHGPTCAFKDYALQLMPQLFVKAREMRGETAETLFLYPTHPGIPPAPLCRCHRR